MMRISLQTGLAFLLATRISWSALPAEEATTDLERDRIYQYFVHSEAPDARYNLGAYLWIPPHTPVIRAVMIAAHNGLPINILQNASVRSVCRKQGIAQILLTPWATDIGKVMFKSLTYDITDKESTDVYDRYLQRLADVSGHPELITAPTVPLAHSAFCEFPFDVAIRKPLQCLTAFPIKAGIPDCYNFYNLGGKARVPSNDYCLRNVPILFIASASQETVGWHPYPHGFDGAGMGSYRRDTDTNPGSDYQPRNELFGVAWNMMSGHFDMFPRDYQNVADWLDTIATERLPDKVGDPLKVIQLKDGWLLNPKIPVTGELPADYAMPAPYLDFKGKRDHALWYPTEKLARESYHMAYDEPRKKIELFTFLDPDGKPISLAQNVMAPMPNPGALLHEDGLLTLTTYHFTTPPDICLTSAKDQKEHPEIPLKYDNVLFPGMTQLPLSNLPLHYHADGGAMELYKTEPFTDSRGVAETRLTLRLKRHRIDPDNGFNMSFVRVSSEGNEEFTNTGRTCQISLSPSDVIKNATEQKVDFSPIADTPGTVDKIDLKATASSGLPVEYFVLKGPGYVQDGSFLVREIPAGRTEPIEVTIGAYQVGLFKDKDGVKPSATVFQTFHLLPPFTK